MSVEAIQEWRLILETFRPTEEEIEELAPWDDATWD